VNGFLLDTNVASELRKLRRADPGVVHWFESADADELFLSVLVVGEIRKGVDLARHQDPVKARALERWLADLEGSYGDRVLPVTMAIADRWGRLGALRPTSTIDGLLAATALVHDLTLVTRNLADVTHTGARLWNPFAPS
jgi:predicted nucleic acid-binding protein